MSRSIFIAIVSISVLLQVLHTVSAFEVAETSITKIRIGFQTGQLTSCEQLISLQLDRIEKYEPSLNALISWSKKEALATARYLDRLANVSSIVQKLPLFCVPCVIKDNYNY